MSDHNTSNCSHSTGSTNNVRVSIIIPVYNPPIEYFNSFIKSALNQTLEQIEIIFVNDASTDDSPKILDGLVDKKRNIRIVHRKENGRAGMSRNDGLNIATGEYILFADCDDILDAQMCERLYSLGKRSDADIVTSSWQIEDPSGRKIGAVELPDKTFNIESEIGQVGGMRYLNNALWNKLFRREMIGDLRFSKYAVNIGEDRLFNVECFCRSRVMLTTSYSGYHYIIHSSSATGRSTKGLSYLDVLRDSEKDVVNALKKAGMTSALDPYADTWALQSFSVGCDWIAKTSSSSDRNEMWNHWKGHFNDNVLPSLNRYKLLKRWYQLLVFTGNTKLIWHGTWLFSRLANKLAIFMRILKIRLRGLSPLR